METLAWVTNTVTLIHGERYAVLVDTFLSEKQSEELADWIVASGKNLTTIYVTHATGTINLASACYSADFQSEGAGGRVDHATGRLSRIGEDYMPSMKIHVLKGCSREEIQRLLDTVQEAMVQSFKVPERDLYQILTEHEPTHLQALDIPRTRDFVLVEIVTRPRSRDEKVDFYKRLAEKLATNCGAASDMMVSMVQNTDDDWSFGMGVAQFLNGELHVPISSTL